jgi:hypothetical protein
MKTLFAFLLLAGSCCAVQYQTLVGDLDLDLPSQPQLATVTFAIGPTTWNVGTFAQSDFGKNTTIKINQQNPASVDWVAANQYLKNGTWEHQSRMTMTINAGSLYSREYWDWPHFEQPLIWGQLIDLSFKPSTFITEVVDGKLQGYVAGNFGIDVNFLPEPPTIWLAFVLVWVLLFKVERRRNDNC